MLVHAVNITIGPRRTQHSNRDTQPAHSGHVSGPLRSTGGSIMFQNFPSCLSDHLHQSMIWRSQHRLVPQDWLERCLHSRLTAELSYHPSNLPLNLCLVLLGYEAPVNEDLTSVGYDVAFCPALDHCHVDA